jgi:hypothetical protein
VVRIPLKAWMFVCVYSVCVVPCVGSGLATGWSPVQGVLLTVYTIKKLKSGQGPKKGCRATDSVVSIATGYGLDDWGVGVRVPVGSRIFSYPRRRDRLWGSTQPYIQWGTRGSFPGGKAAGAWRWPHLQLMPRSRKCGPIHPLSPHEFIAWCLIS